jgi:hypothetical protein
MRERDTLSWILMAFVVIVAAVGSTIAPADDPYPRRGDRPNFGQVVDDGAVPGLVRYEDGSWSDGYCEAGALCDDTVEVAR